MTIQLNPEVERNLRAQAEARGLSLDGYIQELLAKEAGVRICSEALRHCQNLSDLLLSSPFSGADLDLERLKDYPRPVELG